MDEFKLIAELFAPLAASLPGAFGLTDDAAVLTHGAGEELVATMDTLVAGVHFFADDPPDLIAAKLVRVNVSDLAAKGAAPYAALLSAAFPVGTSLDWARAFAAGLGRDLAHFGLALAGGDTVAMPGPLTLTLTVLGRAPAGAMPRRSAARAGDRIWLSGSVGDGALGLMVRRGGLTTLDQADRAFLLDRYLRPQPRLDLGRRLPGLIHAAMDVSDGLIQDLGHICRQSGLGADVLAARLPVSPAAGRAMAAMETSLADLVAGGDDYELLFTAPAAHGPAIVAAAAAVGVAVADIGAMVGGGAIRLLDKDGAEMPIPVQGWRHFQDGD